MTESAFYCPKCGSESDGETRYCRRCGTNVEIVSKAMSVPAIADDELALAQRAFRMRLVRGLGLLVLAAGSAKGLLALIIYAIALGGPLSLWTLLGLIVFGFVPAAFGAYACRDLLQAYELRKDPRRALAELEGVETGDPESVSVKYLSAPPCVTEDSTAPLGRSSEDERKVHR